MQALRKLFNCVTFPLKVKIQKQLARALVHRAPNAAHYNWEVPVCACVRVYVHMCIYIYIYVYFSINNKISFLETFWNVVNVSFLETNNIVIL